MYIFCSNCKTNFSVEDDLIKPDGRKVRCSKCQNVWYQEYFEYKSNLLKTYNLPMVLPTKKVQTYYSLFVVSISLSVLIYMVFLAYVNNLKNSNFNFQKDFAVDILPSEILEHENKVILHYKITNLSLENKLIPEIRVRLLDQDQHIIDSNILEHSDKVFLQPLQYIYIKTEFKEVKNNAERFDLTLGDKSSFILSEIIK
jgi:predicted Zn finger-like uncharacterized protein